MQAYVDAYREIMQQCKEEGLQFDYIFLASSTNATQAGLTVGKLLSGDRTDIVGISVNRGKNRGRDVLPKDVVRYFNEKQYRLPENWEDSIIFSDEYLSGGFGKYDSNIEGTIAKMYQENGIPLDPIYTGKGFYGMIEYLKKNQISEKNVLFWHTGGTPLFFDYLIEKE